MQQVHRCSDGQWICASMTQPQQYQRFVEAVGLPELITDSIMKRWPLPVKEDTVRRTRTHDRC